jgi:hypothetical protein
MAIIGQASSDRRYPRPPMTTSTYATQPSHAPGRSEVAPSSSSTGASSAGRRCAIGSADPRHGDHSQGTRTYEEDGEVQVSVDLAG